MKKLVLVGLMCWPVFFVDAMDSKSPDDARKEEQEKIEAQLLAAWKESGMTLQVEDKREKITPKEQGAQIAVCLMRAPSSMPIPKKPN